MSFELELIARVTSWDEAAQAAASTGSSDYVSVLPGRRRRWGRPLPPSIHFDWREGQVVLSDDADWDHDAFLLSDAGRRTLSATVGVLAELLDPAWGIRAYWIGDPLKRESATTAAALQRRVQASQLDRFTLYRVA